MLRSGKTVGSQTCICDALRACEQRVREDERSNNFTPDDFSTAMTEAYGAAFIEAKRIVAGFLDIDEKGDRLCPDPACDLCITAPLIYAALEDLILSKGDQP
jgi:hypothetical protein